MLKKKALLLSGLLGGARDLRWRVGFNKLKTAAAAAKLGQNSPSHSVAMVSPPTITTSTSISLLTGVTSVQAKWPSTNLANLNLFSGKSTDVGGAYRRVDCSNRSASVIESSAAWRAEGTFNAAKVGVQINANSAGVNFRILVDDVYVSLAGTTAAGASGASYILVDFTGVGGKASRKVAVEFQNFQLWGGFFVAAGDTIAKPAGAPIRGMFAGDSFISSSTGASIVGDGFSLIAGDGLGIRDTWMSGVGSTGYVNTVGGTRYNLGQRITDITTSAADVVFIEMGLNDKTLLSSDIIAAVAADIVLIRAALPYAPIFVIAGWDIDAPSAPSSAFTDMRDAIKAGLASWGLNGQRGVWCLDPTGVSYTKSDTVHPDTAGHATLGAWIVTQTQAILGV